jgi:hypothetical protein
VGLKGNITGLVGIPEGKRLRGISRHKWVENIKMNFKSIGRKVMACTVFFWLR